MEGAAAGHDPDFWIETISYKETRDYVGRVLAFATVYDWRLNGDALNINDRMLGRIEGPRRRFACPLVEAAKPVPAASKAASAKPAATPGTPPGNRAR